MADVGVAADTVRPPTVVGVADEIVVVAQSDPQTAVAVGQPVLTAGMVDEDQLDRLRWGNWVGTAGRCPVLHRQRS